ncbi:hypothetical protein Cob_v007831 [Colletotrichum orbiculare MAFF 240422]|uniref:Uncharacterized protein n=1 Tax=Colletotrichum orbiculare (strain 104-T / ATCC 96160 / CBS 514.97 / LARS 414 / MAFF 240422) TaxID=1213857 RepID=A0A484FLS6_COLOR|nr:hypothetical protein Cob_v007831 [Colletotrichum orbiculare MAFF 240422]
MHIGYMHSRILSFFHLPCWQERAFQLSSRTLRKVDIASTAISGRQSCATSILSKLSAWHSGRKGIWRSRRGQFTSTKIYPPT